MIARQTNKQTHRQILKNVHYSIRIYIIRGYIFYFERMEEDEADTHEKKF